MKHLRPLLTLSILFISAIAHSQSHIPQLGQQSLSNSSYIIDKEGKLWAWGANESGQLGIANTTDQNMPVQVAKPLGVSNWGRIAAGERHAIAVGDSDKLYTWGYNQDGQLGLGTFADQSSPRRVSNPSGVATWRQVSAGEDHTVALANNGMLYAWGSNDRGQLGIGDRVSHSSPQLVPLPTGVTGWSVVAAGAKLTAAVTDQGVPYIWGRDSGFRVWPTEEYLSPRRVAASPTVLGPAWLPDVAANATYQFICNDGEDYTSLGRFPDSLLSIAVGLLHTLRLNVRGDLIATGDNAFGQLGTAEPAATRNTIELPAGVSQWVGLACGARHSLALGNDGNLYAWGDNAHGQLGTSNNQPYTSPAIVRQFTDPLRSHTEVRTSDSAVSVGLLATSSSSLSAPFAFLAIAAPASPESSAAVQLTPSTLLNGESATGSWNIVLHKPLKQTVRLSSYVYSYAAGSAPQITPFALDLRHRVTFHVVDAITKAPVPGAILRWTSPKVIDTTDLQGDATFPVRDTVFQGKVVRENFAEPRTTWAAGTSDTTILVELTPAPVFGSSVTFRGVHRLDEVYALDSLNLWGLSSDSVLHSTNGGAAWQFVYCGTDSLHAIAFVNDKLGYAVGNHGQVIRITAAPDAAVPESNVPTEQNLRSISTANGGIWVLGDSGVVVQKRWDTWTLQHSPHLPAQAIRAIDPDSACVLAAPGIYLRSPDRWSGIKAFMFDYSDFELVEPNLLYLISNNAGLTRSDSWSTTADTVPPKLYPISGATDSGETNVAFLNRNVGFCYGRSGASVTYTAAESNYAPSPSPIAPIWELRCPVASADVAGLHAFFASGDSVVRYSFVAGPTSCIITGRFLRPDSITSVAGARVALRGNDSRTYTTYSTEKGYYVLTGIPLGSNQSLYLTMKDSDGVWDKNETIATEPGQVLRIDFIRPIRAAVRPEGGEGGPHITCTQSSRSYLRFRIEGIRSGATLVLYDGLGRIAAQQMASSNEVSFDNLNLPAGVYFARLNSVDGSAFCRVAVQ